MRITGGYRQWVATAVGAAVLVAGCSSGSGGTADGSADGSAGGGAGPGRGPVGRSGGRAADPFPMTAAPDSGHAARARVTVAEGGELVATDAVGVRYRLVIAPRSLSRDTEVVLTPLAKLAGFPGQSAAYGVDIAPAGTKLALPARLEITPKVPLGKGSWWLQTTGGAQAPQASPGFPSRDNHAVMLSHFSGGGVVQGAAETTAAMNGVSDAPGSTSWVEWQTNVVEQQYRSGVIDRITYEAKMQILKEMRDRAVAEQVAEQVERAGAEADKALDAAEEAADRGDPADQAVIDDAWDRATTTGHNEQVLGYPPNGRVARAFDLWKRYMKARLARCREHPMTAQQILGAERRAQLFGDTLNATGLLRKCLVKEYQAKDGPGSPWNSSGVVTDVSKPFSLHFDQGRASGTFAFTPTGPGGGKVAFTAGGASGTGTYTITEAGLFGYAVEVLIPKVCTPVPLIPCNFIGARFELDPVFLTGTR